MPTARSTRTKAAAVAETEPVEDEFEEMEDDEADDAEVETDDDDLDDLETVEEDEPETAPTKSKATKAKAASAASKSTIQFGSPWLAEHVTELTGEKYDARGIRMLLRKLAKDEVFQREVGVTRERYNFSGPKDPVVLAVVTMVKSGEAKKLKQAGLDKVKADAAAKKAAAKAAREAEAEEPEDDEVEEAPKPRTRAKATVSGGKTVAAPAKAAPSTRRRTAAAK